MISPTCIVCGRPLMADQSQDVLIKGPHQGALVHKGCAGFGITAQPALQLLVIDLGDCCVIKVEQGYIYDLASEQITRLFKDWTPQMGHRLSAQLYPKSFTDLKAVLDDEKPVPRIERRGATESPWPYILTTANGSDYLTADALANLSQLAGRPLPIYEPKEGKWEELYPAFSGMRFWRYTR